MIPIQIVYFSVSAEQEWNHKKGSFVELAYQADLRDVPDAIKAFDFLENIHFRMEWKETVDGTDYLITSHELSPFPQRIILVQSNEFISGRRKCFLDRESFLAWESRFFNLADLTCHISLTPVLASTRRSISMERQVGYYRLTAVSEGNPPLAPITSSVIY